MVIHRCGKEDHKRAAAYRQRLAIHVTVDDHQGRADSQSISHPRIIVDRRFSAETALPEANSFPSGCQPFCRILIGVLSRG
jgi:hypothetical protein